MNRPCKEVRYVCAAVTLSRIAPMSRHKFKKHLTEAMQAKVEAAGGVIVKPIFAFPGGRRFHFRDPAGNELAVWSET